MFKMVAFDLDGTIADTIPLCIRAFHDSVAPYTDQGLTREDILQLFGLNEIGMIKAVAGQNWQAPLDDFYKLYLQLHEEVTRPFPGILKLISYLKEKNISIPLITGKGEKSCAISLAYLGMSNTFDEVLCGSELSPNKAECIEYLLKKHTLDKEDFCYVGDTLSDIKACKKAGVICLSAAWMENSPYDALEKENPRRVFLSVQDLIDYLDCCQKK